MDKDRLWILINQQLDEQNSRQEEEELRRELENSAKARHLMAEMRELAQDLESLEPPEQTESLVPSVMGAITEKGRSRRPETRMGLAGLGARLSSPYLWLYPLAAGVVLGLLIGLLWQDASLHGVRIEDLYATIGSASEWTSLTQQNLGSERVRVSRSGKTFLIDIDVRESAPLELEFHYDEVALALKGISCLPSCNLRTAPGTLSVLPRGAGREQLLWELSGDSPSRVELHLRRSGVLTHQSSWAFEASDQ